MFEGVDIFELVLLEMMFDFDCELIVFYLVEMELSEIINLIFREVECINFVCVVFDSLFELCLFV